MGLGGWCRFKFIRQVHIHQQDSVQVASQESLFSFIGFIVFPSIPGGLVSAHNARADFLSQSSPAYRPETRTKVTIATAKSMEIGENCQKYAELLH